MPNAILLIGQQLNELWKQLGINQKVSTIIALMATIGIIGGLVYWSSQPSYRLLYSGMSLQDAAKAREKISEEQIPVKLKDSGRAIYVPAADVYRVRLLLAQEGLPEDSSTGFELFETPKFGLTDFAQKVNYQRALAGELERTITSMNGIVGARVLLVLPKEKLFASQDEKQSSASIIVTVAGGSSLSAGQARSVKQLVASAVSGLSSSSITITDQDGRLLSQGTGAGEEEMGAATEQLDTQEKLESLLREKAQAMLDAALGKGQSIVRVSTLLDFSTVERTKETIDAEGRVVSSESISSESSDTPLPQSGGPVGARVNMPIGNPESAVTQQQVSKTKREDIETEYITPRSEEHSVEKGARIKSLSVSVCVAEMETKRTEEELKSIEDMVKTAVGYSETAERSDAIKVVEMKFPEPKEQEATAWWSNLPLHSIGTGLAGAILLIIIMIISKRILAGLSVEREDIGIPVSNLAAMSATPQLNTGVSSTMPQGNMKHEPNIDQVTQIAEQNPTAVAAWITNISKE